MREVSLYNKDVQQEIQQKAIERHQEQQVQQIQQIQQIQQQRLQAPQPLFSIPEITGEKQGRIDLYV